MTSANRSTAIALAGGALVLTTLAVPPAQAAPIASARTSASAAVLFAKAAPLPARGVASYKDLKVRCTNYGKYVQVSATPTATVNSVPTKKRWKLLKVISYYQQLVVKIQTPAGYGGTLWKTLATKKYTQKTSRIPPTKNKKYLPSWTRATAAYNTKYGSGEYRVELTVSLKRDVAGAPDTKVWQYQVASGTRSCVSVG